MALKQVGGMSSILKNKIEANNKKREESRIEVEAIKAAVPEFDEEEIRKRIEKELKKKTRTLQRSIKFDKRVNDWLDNVKRYQKEELGIPRPCLDDLMYDAIVEYLTNKYPDLAPKR